MGGERSSALPGDKALIRNSSGRANYRYRAPAIAIGPFMHGPDTRISAGEHRLFRSIREEEDEDEEAARSVSPMIASFTGESCKAPYARASSQPAASHRNETWDDDVTTTSSAPIAAPYEPSNCVKSIISHISDDSCSTRKQSLSLKPSLNSYASSKCRAGRVAKHVHFTFTDKEMSYEVTSDDIENSWLDIDVSSAIEALENGSHDAMVSFGPTGRFTSSDLDVCKNGKEYMVRIQKRRLINEMLGQRTNLRQSVFEEQARQKREGIVDAEEMCAVASKQSKWGVEIAKSSWWLCQT